MKITIETKKNSELIRQESEMMYHAKLKEYGAQDIRDFKKGYPNSIFFFVKEEGKVVAFGTFRNLTLGLAGKEYKIFGICNIMALKKGREYGRILISGMISYLKRTGKTGLGFCVPKNTLFYKKAGFNVKENMIKKVVYKNPEGKLEPEDNGDGFYYEGDDNLITKLLQSNLIAYTDLKEW